MASESLVQQLLDEISDSGRTPEEVCALYPHLLPDVRRRWQQLRQVEAELEAVFPTPGFDKPAPWHPGVDLPRRTSGDVERPAGRNLHAIE